ncbi:unnamed protein product [Alternaria alternata]
MPSHPVVETLANKHEELQDFNDEVVGLRFRIAAKRKKLRDLRVETSEKDGHVFDLLRKYLHASKADLPPHIEEALEDASSLRDKLGPMEADYDDAEADYNTLEWSYTDKERRFMDEISSSGIVANGVYRRAHDPTRNESSSLTEFSDCYPEAWDHTAFSDHSASESNPKTLAKVLSDENERFANEHLGANGSIQTPLQSYLSSKMRRVNVWVMKIIEDSPVQRTQLREALGLQNFDDKTWWSFAKQLLVQESRNVTAFHTGDSTIFSSSNNQPASAIAMVEPCVGERTQEDKNAIFWGSEPRALDVGENHDIQDASKWEDKARDGNEEERASSGLSNTKGIVVDPDTVNENTSDRTSCGEVPVEKEDHISHRSSSCEISARPPEKATFKSSVCSSLSDLGPEQQDPGEFVNPTLIGQDSADVLAPPVIDMDEHNRSPNASLIEPPSNIKTGSLPSTLQEGRTERLEAETKDSSQTVSIATPSEKRRWSLVDPEPMRRSPKRHAGPALDAGATPSVSTPTWDCLMM